VLDEIRMVSCQKDGYADGLRCHGALATWRRQCARMTGIMRIIMNLERDIRSGRTLYTICEVLNVHGPASLKICTLLDKYERREVEVPHDYAGFHIPNKCVFGYGLDLDELYRNLPYKTM
jgi:hypoxanthine phosphoribosyltransferase